MDIHLRRANTTDLAALQTMAIRTFRDTFAADNTPENLNAYIEKAYNLDQLQAELDDSGVEYWFALQGETPVGFLMLKLNSPLEKRKGLGTEIQRIYVSKDLLGTGAGKLLFDVGLQRAKQLGSKWLWLGVWKSNLRAVRFYKKQGMEIVGEQVFAMGDDPQEDWVMAVALPSD